MREMWENCGEAIGGARGLLFTGETRVSLMVHVLRIATALILLIVRTLLVLVVLLFQQLSGQLDCLVPGERWVEWN